MASLPLKLMMSFVALALVLAAAPADAAKARKHKKTAHAAAVAVKPGYRGTALFPAGPVYHANDYLGDDPDPFIRLQLQRDLNAHYGGEP